MITPLFATAIQMPDITGIMELTVLNIFIQVGGYLLQWSTVAVTVAVVGVAVSWIYQAAPFINSNHKMAERLAGEVDEVQHDEDMSYYMPRDADRNLIEFDEDDRDFL